MIKEYLFALMFAVIMISVGMGGIKALQNNEFVLGFFSMISLVMLLGIYIKMNWDSWGKEAENK